ncbi:MAG: tRNA uridine-5-carboxymethylaminomethyl(34) synthesis GTPase MnmE [Lachnospiraceae bacterium]|nr:tRNA uridine-5-carboxymethylaminomethyl(34) synthesis GTPase MnmE [Lachnospiraceae bacterium]
MRGREIFPFHAQGHHVYYYTGIRWVERGEKVLSDSDTIAAISTALGGSGIAIVRISGSDAIQVGDRVFTFAGGKQKLSDKESHTIHYGYVVDDGKTIDEVLVSLMRSPRSFTTEDTVEINCHGGIYATKRVLDTVLKNGARLAEPGEFTKRAFLNGRIDLSQAESVIDVIQAKNEYALQNSLGQLRGSLGREINALRERILYQTAFIESALDDPEHYSLDGYPEKLCLEISDLLKNVNRLIATSDNGRLMKEGIQTVILGKPNAGKSSLLNVLAREERAIVTDIAGTTRDTLEETISLGGITLQLVDTAGIRTTDDVIEKIGVSKAENMAGSADLILYVVDSTAALDENDEKILSLLENKKVIVLLNKSDLEPVVTLEQVKAFICDRYPVIEVSAKEETGLDLLTDTLQKIFYQGDLSFNDETYITSARVKSELLNTKCSLEKVLESISIGLSEDFFSIDLMDAYAALGRIIGKEVGEDLVNEIFGRFCMGK